MRISDWSSDVCSSDLGFDGILKFIEQDAGDPFQFAALGGGKMIEIGPHRHPIVAGVIASAGSASGGSSRLRKIAVARGGGTDTARSRSNRGCWSAARSRHSIGSWLGRARERRRV